MAGQVNEGLWITLDGLGGSGKSTVVRLLVRWLGERAIPVVATREPGGTALGEQLRALLLAPTCAPIPLAETFLFAADRAQTCADVIAPALTAGAIVVSDRSVYGSIAYQSFGHGVDLSLVDQLCLAATNNRWPDLVFVLDIDPLIARKRMESRKTTDRFDAEDLAYQRRVRDGYLFAASRDAGRAYVLDASQPAEAVFALVRERVAMCLRDRLP